MDPVTASLIASIVGYAVRYGIPAAIQIGEHLSKPDATVPELVALLRKHDKTTEDYLAAARLRAGQAATGNFPPDTAGSHDLP